MQRRSLGHVRSRARLLMNLHLRTSHPGRLLHVERRTCFLERLARDSTVAVSVVLSLIFANSAQGALLQLGLVLAALGVAHVLASGSVRLTPDELVIRSGWKRLLLPRSRVRRAWLEHVRSQLPARLGSLTLWVEVRDESGAGPTSMLKALRVHYLYAAPSPPEVVERLLQALAEFDLRPSLTGEPLPEPASSPAKDQAQPAVAVPTPKVVDTTPPREPPEEVRDLTPEQRALVLRQMELPPGTRFFPADLAHLNVRRWDGFFGAGFYCFPLAGAYFYTVGHYFLPITGFFDVVATLFLSGLGALTLYVPLYFVHRAPQLERARRVLPGAGVYLLPEGAMRVLPGQAAVVVPATAVLKVEKVQRGRGMSSRNKVQLHYRDSAGHNQVLPLTGTRLLAEELEREAVSWIEEMAAPKRTSRREPTPPSVGRPNAEGTVGLASAPHTTWSRPLRRRRTTRRR